MRYAQYKGGQKLHLVYEPGEGHGEHIVRAGFLSAPLCGKAGLRYRMTINLPLGNACRNCSRVYEARHGRNTQ